MMKRGFTVLEMLVASMLVGLLLTIMTMVFNQTNIAWRTGSTTVAKLNNARNGVARARVESDNCWIWGGKGTEALGVLSVWKYSSSKGVARLQGRTLTIAGAQFTGNQQISTIEQGMKTEADVRRTGDLSHDFSLPTYSAGAKNGVNYTVNVRSAGPNHAHGDFDDIWSYPDDFDM